MNVVGYTVAGGQVCMDSDCFLAAWPRVGRPIVEGDASDERGFLTCSSCTDVLDEKSELRHWLDAPIPTPSWIVDRARTLGMIA